MCGKGYVGGRQQNYLKILELFNLVRRRFGNRIAGYEGELERGSIYFHIEGQMDTK